MHIKGYCEIWGDTARLLQDNGFDVPPEINGIGCDSFEISDKLFVDLNLEYVPGTPARPGRLRVKGKIY